MHCHNKYTQALELFWELSFVFFPTGQIGTQFYQCSKQEQHTLIGVVYTLCKLSANQFFIASTSRDSSATRIFFLKNRMM